MGGKEDKISMRLPPSYQAPVIEEGLDTGYSADVYSNLNLTADARHSSKSLTTQTRHNKSNIASTTAHPGQIYPTTNDTANEANNTYLHIHTKNKLQDKAPAPTPALSETQTQTLLAALPDLLSSHEQRLKTLATIETSVLDHDIAATTLDFTDAAGQEKGSATLAERMAFFEARVHDIRCSVEEVLSERLDVESQIESVRRELVDLLGDGSTRSYCYDLGRE